MSVTVRVPSPLRTLTAGVAHVEVEASDLRGAIAALEQRYPGFADRVLDESGALRRFVNVFVRDEDVRFLNGLETPIPEGAKVSIIPAVAGG